MIFNFAFWPLVNSSCLLNKCSWFYTIIGRFFIASANADISVRNLSIDAVVVEGSEATLGDSAAAAVAGCWFTWLLERDLIASSSFVHLLSLCWDCGETVALGGKARFSPGLKTCWFVVGSQTSNGPTDWGCSTGGDVASLSEESITIGSPGDCSCRLWGVGVGVRFSGAVTDAWIARGLEAASDIKVVIVGNEEDLKWWVGEWVIGTTRFLR